MTPSTLGKLTRTAMFTALVTLALNVTVVAPLAAAPAPKAVVPQETSAAQLVRLLEAQGVTKVFGVPGEETLHLVDALRKSKRIDFVLSTTEQGASFMATGYARATGKLGVALSTLGPGATNLVTGAANALSEGIKVLFITGQAPVKRPLGYHQKMSLTTLFKSVTRATIEPKRGAEVLAATQKLLATAQAKPGPVHLSLPADVAGQLVPTVSLARIPSAKRAAPTNASVRKIAKLIKDAAFPVIVAGDGILREHGDRTAWQVLAFARVHGIPVVPSTIAKGMFPWQFKEVMPVLDANAKGAGGDFVRRADLIISVGYHPTETFDPAQANPKNKAVVVQLSQEKLTRAQRITGMKPQVEVVSRLSTALRDIHRALNGHKAPASVRQAGADVRKVYEAALATAAKKSPEQGKALAPERVISEIKRALGEAGKSGKGQAARKQMVFADIGINKGQMTHWYKVDQPRELMINNGLSTMGIALPSAVGAKLANRKLNVVSVSGDGGFMMTAQELAVAAVQKLPMAHVVFIDKQLGLIENHQHRQGFKASGVTLPSTLDVVAIAKGLGAEGFMVKDAKEIGPLIKRALGGDKPVLIGVPVDYSAVHAKATAEGKAQRKEQQLAAGKRAQTKNTSLLGTRIQGALGRVVGLLQNAPRPSRLQRTRRMARAPGRRLRK